MPEIKQETPASAIGVVEVLGCQNLNCHTELSSQNICHVKLLLYHTLTKPPGIPGGFLFCLGHSF